MEDALPQRRTGTLSSFVRRALSVLAYRLCRAAFRLAKRATVFPRLGNVNHYAPRKLTAVATPAGHGPRHRWPMLSIVTPSLNQGAFIGRTIDSVLRQGYPRLEYFVQDGGSTDETRTVLESLRGRISGWRSAADGGQAQAINLGFGRTSGEIMAWLNSDDLLLPGALARVASYFDAHPQVDAVYGNRLLIDVADMEVGRWLLPGHDGGVLSWADYVPQETLFWRRSLWEQVGAHVDESFSFAMDWDLLLRFRDAGARFAHLPHFLGAFRVHAAQKTSSVMHSVGAQEMTKIRARELGHVPTNTEIQLAVMPFLLRHMAVDSAYRMRAWSAARAQRQRAALAGA